MPLPRSVKNQFRVNRGLNTEMNELNFADGFSTDERNYELLQDGSRRRRKGLAAESGAGSAKTVDTLGSGYYNQTYLWKNAGGDPSKEFVVLRTGDFLYFATAGSVVSTGWYTGAGSSVSLDPFRTDSATDALVQKGSVSFAQGRGYLFVSGQYIKPFYVMYDPSGDDFTAIDIEIFSRDFTTIDEGKGIADQPTGTITDDHRYNLRNRGWSESDMAQYNTDQSAHPALNQIWYRAYKRVADESTASAVEKDGTRTWDSAKLAAEGFGATSAAVGAMFISPFDTTTGYTGATSSGGVLNITTWSYVDNGSDWDVTLTTSAAHGLSATDTFTLSGLTFDYLTGGSEPRDIWDYSDWNGAQTAIAGTSGTSLVFNVTEPAGFSSFTSQYKTLGQVDTDSALVRSTGTDHGDSFKAIEFHAGRVFYAGMINSEFNDTIFFSQIVDGIDKAGKCYQEADPTDENFNAIVASDGGAIVIPGLGHVLNMRSLRNSIIVLATNGVWEISGGQRGVFTPDGYSVRNITETASNGPDGSIVVENTLIFTSPDGIYAIAPNQYTGILESQSITEQTIQTLWNDIADAEQERVQMAYDSSQRRMYIMYGPDGTSFAIDTMLIYDLRAQGWTKYTFDTPTNNVLMSGLALSSADTTSNNERMKFIYEVSTTTVQVGDFNQTSFDDWDGTNGPLPYVYTAWDNIGDFQSRRQAPIITVYSARTETGYDATGKGANPVNDSSTLMSAYWDWASDATNEVDRGKITATQQVYRKPRGAFEPTSTSDLDGYPVVVSRNKVRGRGRVLQLKFEGATDKDSHILGWTTNYEVDTRA